MENYILEIILIILVFNYMLSRFLDTLNDRNWSASLPKPLQSVYDEEKYLQSMAYHRAKSSFNMLTSTFGLVILVVMLAYGGFAYIDEWVRSFTEHPVWVTLFFFGLIAIGSDLISIPFSLYNVFVIEERFGFNRTSLKTFWTDKLKSYALAVVIGGVVLSIFVMTYIYLGSLFWVFSWLVAICVLVFFTAFYATLILPLFNQLTPLESGELRQSIEAYCKKVNFRAKDIMVMDGSKRSAKANAFFSGLGPKKKIVLYDTLVEKLNTDELVAVLAHEVGHYKKRHSLQGLFIAVFQTGLMLFILSQFIDSRVLSQTMGADVQSFHMGLLAFSLLYSPFSLILSVFVNTFSRQNEFEADAYAAKTHDSSVMSNALKKMTVDHLTHPTPHPAYVFVYYSHPPLISRLTALSGADQKQWVST